MPETSIRYSRENIAKLMEKLSYKPTAANKAFGVLRKIFNLAEAWGYRADGTGMSSPFVRQCYEVSGALVFGKHWS